MKYNIELLKTFYKNYFLTSKSVLAVHDKKLFFMLIPKVACSTIMSIVVDLLNFEMPDKAWKPAVFRSDKYDEYIDLTIKKTSVIRLKSIPSYSDYFGFALVRNPYDRLVSCYVEKLRLDGPKNLFTNGVSNTLLKYGCFYYGMQFEEFVKCIVRINDSWADHHFISQSYFLRNKKLKADVNHIGRFENLSKEFEMLSEKLNVEIQVPHLLKSQRLEWQSYYDKSLKNLVAERYKTDFENFNYKT